MSRASRRARPYVINSAFWHASTTVIGNGAAAVPKVFGASLSVITKRSLSVPSGASWIAKAGEVLPQALIPDHEKLALKAEAACIEVSRSTAANPKALGNWRIFDPFPTVGQNRRFSNRDNT
jgi:hypothetical protein